MLRLAEENETWDVLITLDTGLIKRQDGKFISSNYMENMSRFISD